MEYFLDKSSLISNESVQNIWSAILAGEREKRGSSVSKVMLDRLALLDDISAQSFGALLNLLFEQIYHQGWAITFLSISETMTLFVFQENLGFLRE